MVDDEPRPCSFCTNDATHVCPRCGRAYCDEHGRDLCRDCLAPAGALPSERLFRGSLLALVLAGLIGIWVLVAPETLPGERRLARTAAQNPAAVQAIRRNGAGSNAAVPSPVPPLGSPTPLAARSYTVVFGDTLNGIAQSFGTTVEAIEAANPGVSPSHLIAGQELLIPPPGVTPTPAPTATPSPTPSPSPTPTPSPSPSPSPTPSPTPSPSPSPTESPTPAPTASPAASPTTSPTPSPSETPTPAATEQATPSPTPSP